MLEQKSSIEKLRWIMTQLRDPATGCPWDLKQTFATIVPHTLEEAYEVVETINQQDWAALPNELGDLLFQVVFYAQLGQEQQLFDWQNILDEICEKLIRRHPHVFGQINFASEAEIKANWENTKAEERAQKQQDTAQQLASILDDIPHALPALSQAQKIQKRCAHVGFDWPEITPVVEKIAEELEEVKHEITEQNNEALAEEIGDLLFAAVNLARHAGFDAETLLRQANIKFTKRFKQVEQLAQQSDKSMEQHSLDELDQYWQQAKKVT